MASVTKSVSGSVTTFTVVDQASVSGTIAVTANVSGQTVTISATGWHLDGVQLAVNLLQQIQTGLVPGDGAQGLIP